MQKKPFDQNDIKYAEMRGGLEREFYVVYTKSYKTANGDSVSKSYVASTYGTRFHAERELRDKVKKLGGKVQYFGAFQKPKK